MLEEDPGDDELDLMQPQQQQPQQQQHQQNPRVPAWVTSKPAGGSSSSASLSADLSLEDAVEGEVPSEFAALGGKVVRRPVHLASEKSAGEGTEPEHEDSGKEEEEGEGGDAYDSDEEQWDEILGAGGSGESSDFTSKGTSKATLGAKKGRDERQGRVKWSEKEVHWLREGVAAYGEGRWAQIREFCDPALSTIHFLCGELYVPFHFPSHKHYLLFHLPSFGLLWRSCGPPMGLCGREKAQLCGPQGQVSKHYQVTVAT